MSRIGRRKLNIPDKVDVSIDGKEIKVKGPKGELTQKLHSHIKVDIKDKEITVRARNSKEKNDRALWGLFNALINNMIIGVSEGFKKELEINGVGYKAVADKKKVTLNVGYSHPVEMDLPEGVECVVEKNVITITGYDKSEVGNFAAKIRATRPPEPYKGKGIKYVDEQIIRKAGKQVKGAEGEG